jgi:hypothetical protein
MEADRIALAFAHDPNFAVSLSGVRGFPHQIVAVYRHMRPQARLRFVLADDRHESRVSYFRRLASARRSSVARHHQLSARARLSPPIDSRPFSASALGVRS